MKILILFSVINVYFMNYLKFTLYCFITHGYFYVKRLTRQTIFRPKHM